MTNAEILAAIELALSTTTDDDGAMTMNELSEALALGHQAVRVRLRALKAAGRLEVVRVKRESLAGIMQPVWAYKILSS